MGAQMEYADKTVLITGAARGQGRVHAVAYAERGADVILLDRCADSTGVNYPLATEADLAETVRLVQQTGRRCHSAVVDTGDRAALEAAIAAGEAAVGAVDVAIANAGVSAMAPITGHDQAVWDEVINSNLTGVFNTIAAVAPGMAERGYGRIVTISSMLGRSSAPGQAAYCASKWGVIGMSKSAAQELAHSGVNVNVIAPGNIDTPMVRNDNLFRVVRPDLDEPTWEDVGPVIGQLHAQPVDILDPYEITRAALFLTGPDSTHITGIVVPVDAGAATRTSS